MVSCWIQSANFESTDRGSVDAKQAVKIFQEHDWSFESQRRSELELAGHEFCDPGIGLVSSDGRILHLGPSKADKSFCHYHFRERLRVLGLPLWYRKGVCSKFDIERSEINEYINRFFANDHAWLRARAA